MLNKDTEQLIVNLSQAIISVKGLVNALEKPVYVAPVLDGKLTPIIQSKISPPMGSIGIEFLLDRAAARIGICKFGFCLNTISKLTAFDYVVSIRLALAPEYWSTFWIPIKALPEVDDIIDGLLKQNLEFSLKSSNVVSSNDVLLKAYAGGTPGKKAVIIVPPCGMPVELCQRWLHYLAQEYYVITWESRGLFGEIKNSDILEYDVVSQASDLFAVMDYFNVKSAHVMGLCGGAVIALIASSIQPERISSLSLWHGDYELGSNCPKTRHQKDLQILMSMAGKSREQAISLQKLFTQPSILANIRIDLAHLILYPYATGELLFRYAKLNGSIMTADIGKILGKILQSILVVTSEDDTTAHPEGSLYLAQMLPNAKLHVESHGNHLSFFDADPAITKLATRFINNETLSKSQNSQSQISNSKCDRLYKTGDFDRRTLPAPDQIQQTPVTTFVAPRDELETYLTKIWENVLGIKPISIKDNFFDLGGHSLLAVRLFDQIEKTFSKNLPLATLFQGSTIEELANILRLEDEKLTSQKSQPGSTDPWSSLVAIQPNGSKPPLFCIHGAGGDVLSYRELARHLDIEQPVYGLRARGLDGKQLPHTRIEDMASHYIKEIQTLQPNGPYFLGGYSFGGTVAFEIAQQLYSQGQKVALLILFDSSGPNSGKRLPFLKRVPLHVNKLLKLGLNYIWEKAGQWSNLLPQKVQKIVYKFYLNIGRPLPRALRHFHIIETNVQAARVYTIKVHPGQVLLLRTDDLQRQEGVGFDFDPQLGWDKFVAGELKIHYVPGSHHSFLREPHVQVLAEKLQACLDNAQVNN